MRLILEISLGAPRDIVPTLPYQESAYLPASLLKFCQPKYYGCSQNAIL